MSNSRAKLIDALSWAFHGSRSFAKGIVDALDAYLDVVMSPPPIARVRELEAGKMTATMSCPKCGQVASLSGHTIHPGGAVHPSVVCPHEGCDFHEYVALEGWQP